MARRTVRHVRGRPRMSKVWVPTEAIRMTGNNTPGVGTFNYLLEINNLVAASDDIQVPFNFVTAGNTVGTSARDSIRAARDCTILAVSASVASEGVDTRVGYIGLGVGQPLIATSGPELLPRVIQSDAPGIWPYVSPMRPVGIGSTATANDIVYTADNLQKGRRRLSPGMVIYSSIFFQYDVAVQYRILFGVPE